MKLSQAFLIGVLSSLPSSAFAQCRESAVLNPCESALFDAATRLDAKHKTCLAELDGEKRKLKTRTSTVIREIVLPCPPAVVQTDEIDAVTLSTAVAAVSFALGLIAGLLVVR